MLSKPIALACVLIFAAEAAAQTHPAREPIAPLTTARSWDQLTGSRVRISSGTEGPNSKAVIGVLLGARSDTLILRVDGSPDAVHLVLNHSTRIEEWHRDNPTKGYVVAGVLIGSLVGGATAAVINDAPEPTRCPDNLDNAASVVMCELGAGFATALDQSVDQFLAVAAGVVIGAVIGGLSGKSRGRSRVTQGWRTVSPVELRVQPTLRNGVQFSVSLTH